MKKITLGILRETKNPPDRRVPLTPDQCRRLLDTYPELDIRIQPSEGRCYSDDEYIARKLTLAEDLGDCQILMGVKEVKIPALLPDKTYLFFSHTAKEQPYNRPLLQEVVRKRIRMIDYEYLTDENGVRVVAFGRWAGVVGAYNGLRAWGLRKKTLSGGGFVLPPANECRDFDEMKQLVRGLDPGPVRILVTGGGRVAGGALEILTFLGAKELAPDQFPGSDPWGAVFTRLDPQQYVRRTDGGDFDFAHFVAHPADYENALLPYAAHSDLFLACHYWDPRSPVMLTREDLNRGDLPLGVVADISCDIAGPIASTIRPSTIADPLYGYDPATGKETDTFRKEALTVMAVDNLPGELPRDASADFGEALMSHVIPELLGRRDTGMLERAGIAAGGSLTPRYAYLQDFLSGN